MSLPEQTLIPSSSSSNLPLSSRSQSPSFAIEIDNSSSIKIPKNSNYVDVDLEKEEENVNEFKKEKEGEKVDERILNNQNDIELLQNGKLDDFNVVESEKPWKYKIMALICALFLAGNSINFLDHNHDNNCKNYYYR